MLVFVDFEHADGHDRKHGERMLAARTKITYRLEDLTGMHCHLVRYNRLDAALLENLDASAIFISGNSSAPDAYAPQDLECIHHIIRETDLPIFGLCGGFQLMAQALGADLVALEASRAHADDDSITITDDGRVFEFGYHPVDLLPESDNHPLLADVGARPVFRHAHGLHIPELPDGFENLASTAVTPVQLAAHTQRKLAGAQFHPEYWTEEYPAGLTLIENFLRWSGL